MRRVIIHHAHHGDEGLYRLVYVYEDTVQSERPNPAFALKPMLNKAGVVIKWIEPRDVPRMLVDTEVLRCNPQEIVWADDDERWKDMGDEQIAQMQRTDVFNALRTQEATDQGAAQTEKPRQLTAGHFEL
jgi:hypothetical protein